MRHSRSSKASYRANSSPGRARSPNAPPSFQLETLGVPVKRLTHAAQFAKHMAIPRRLN